MGVSVRLVTSKEFADVGGWRVGPHVEAALAVIGADTGRPEHEGGQWRVASRSVAERTGMAAVEMARNKLTVDRILTAEAFENAMRVLLAIGGSTNGIVHLTAIAGRVGLDVDLDALDRMGRETPVLLDDTKLKALLPGLRRTPYEEGARLTIAAETAMNARQAA